MYWGVRGVQLVVWFRGLARKDYETMHCAASAFKCNMQVSLLYTMKAFDLGHTGL